MAGRPSAQHLAALQALLDQLELDVRVIDESGEALVLSSAASRERQSATEVELPSLGIAVLGLANEWHVEDRFAVSDREDRSLGTLIVSRDGAQSPPAIDEGGTLSISAQDAAMLWLASFYAFPLDDLDSTNLNSLRGRVLESIHQAHLDRVEAKAPTPSLE